MDKQSKKELGEMIKQQMDYLDAMKPQLDKREAELKAELQRLGETRVKLDADYAKFAKWLAELEGE